jgi:hypothetical protein
MWDEMYDMAVSAASPSWEVFAEAAEFHYNRERNDDGPTETFNE